MKWFFIILVLISSGRATEEDSYFFVYPKGSRFEKKIKNDRLYIEVPIQKIDPPKVISILAFHQGLGPGREYQIQINLAGHPPRGWLPMLRLKDDIITSGISVGHAGETGGFSTYSIELSNPEKIDRWCLLLGSLLKVPFNRIEVDLAKKELEHLDKK